MNTARFLGLGGPQWILIVSIVSTACLLPDAFAGHYRRAFVRRVQYVPFITGSVLVVCAAGTVLWPDQPWLHVPLLSAAWIALASGVIGSAVHAYFGTFAKPGGYRWTLHYAMYGAPVLAPLALSANGFLTLVAGRALMGRFDVGGVPLGITLFGAAALSLTGAAVQAAILHYRGAFNNPLMYLPVTAPLAAVIALVAMIVRPSAWTEGVLIVALWATIAVGIVGLGMHLRGFDRQMGGLGIALANWLQGPPAFAPALFTCFAAVGLIAVYLF